MDKIVKILIVMVLVFVAVHFGKNSVSIRILSLSALVILSVLSFRNPKDSTDDK